MSKARRDRTAVSLPEPMQRRLSVYALAASGVTTGYDTVSGALLTGYAYETVPGKASITGRTKGLDAITLEPGNLGRLAQGSAGRLGK